MTREDKLKLVVTAIERMVSTHVEIEHRSRRGDEALARGRGAHYDISSLPSAEELRQELLRALVQADTREIIDRNSSREPASDFDPNEDELLRTQKTLAHDAEFGQRLCDENEKLRDINLDLMASIARALMILRNNPVDVGARNAQAILSMALEVGRNGAAPS